MKNRIYGYPFTSLEKLLHGSTFSGVRKKAIEDLSLKGLPSPRVEDWKYTDLKRLSSQAYSLVNSSEESQEPPTGTLADQYSGQSFERISLMNGGLISKSEKLSIRDNEVASDVLRSSVQKNDGFDNLLIAFAKKIFELRISDGDRLWFESYLDGRNNDQCTFLDQSNVNIIVPENTRASLVVSIESTDDTQALFNQFLKFHIARNSSLDFVLIQDVNYDSDVVQRLEFSCEESSGLNFLNISRGAKLARTEASISTLGKNCQVNANAIVVALDGQHHDVRMDMNHNYPEGFSDQLFKSILSNGSRAVFNGKIFIAPQAQKIDSNLLNNNLVLDEKSEVDTKPELDIYADDVKATHGATIGQLNKEELFYLESRGIPKALASKLMAEGFVSQPIYRMKSPEVIELLQSIFKESSWLKNLEIS